MSYDVVMSDRATSVRLTEEQAQALGEIGRREERSRSWLIRRAIDEFIGRHLGRSEAGEKSSVATRSATETIKAPLEIKEGPGQTVRSRRDSNPQPLDP